MVAVSATLPNIVDIAKFIEATEAFAFDDSYRPVPLKTHVIGQGMLGEKSTSQYHFWKNIDRGVPEIVRKYSNNLPSIIFCHSKLDTENLADSLAIAYNIGKRENHCATMASNAKQARLQRVLLYGIGFHHAGLESEDRKLVESHFRTGKIKVLCATSTLAMGVNLPAHLVVIKGTKAWRGSCNGYQDIDDATLLQMIGRAGRPGFDTSGTAVIMTDNDSKTKYERIAKDGNGEAKSKLITRLVESMNTEISQRVVTSIDEAINWIKTTLFYIQLQRNPSMHGIHAVSAFSVDAHVLRICKEAIHMLEKIDAVVISGEQDIIPKPGCHIMSQHLVDYQAMEKFQHIPSNAKQGDILRAISQIDGLQHPVRKSEKKMLNEAHKIIKMYKLDGPASKVRVQLPWEKAFVLLQVYIDKLDIDMPFTLRQEMISIVEYASRMLVAFEEYSILGSKNGNVIVQTLKLRRSLALRLWCAGESQLQQIPGVNKSLAFTLQLGGVTTFSDVLKYSETELEKRASRMSPFGAEIRRACTAILSNNLTLKASLVSPDIHTESSVLRVIIEKKSSAERTDEHFITNNESSSQVRYSLVGFTDEGGSCFLHRSDLSNPVKYDVSIPSQFTTVSIYLIASIIGLDEMVAIQGADTRNDDISAISASQSQLFTTIPTTGRPKIRDPKRIEQLTAKRGSVKQIADNSLYADLSMVGKGNPTFKITPSPKSMDPHLDENQFSKFSRDDQNVSQEVSMMQCNAPTPFHSPYENDSYMSKEVGIQRKAEAAAIKLSTRIGQPTSCDSSSDMNNLVYHSQGMECSDSGFTPWYLRNRWKRAKSEQTKVQRRAFMSGRENPFSQYKHDPNDTESYLDSLSFRGHAQFTTKRNPKPTFCAGQPFGCIRAPPATSCASVPKQRNSALRLSTQDLLASKAREAAVNLSTVPSRSISLENPSFVRRPLIFKNPQDRFVPVHPPQTACWPQTTRNYSTHSNTSSYYPPSLVQLSQSISMEPAYHLGTDDGGRQSRPLLVPTYRGSYGRLEGTNIGGYSLTSNRHQQMLHIPNQGQIYGSLPQRGLSGVSAYPIEEDQALYSDWAFF
jgi:Sec63 Brl domain/Helicase conserved C-terminal domain